MSDKSMFHHYMRGRWRVRYPDGFLSQPFEKDTARTYQSLFGGTVERVPGREPWWLRLWWFVQRQPRKNRSKP